MVQNLMKNWLLVSKWYLDLVNFTGPVGSLQLWNWISLFSWKYALLQLKIYRGVSRSEEWCKSWDKLTRSFKSYVRNSVNFWGAVLNFKVLCARFIPAINCLNEGVMRYDTEEWCKIWRKNESWYQKWYWKCGEFHGIT